MQCIAPSALQPSLGSSGVSVCHGWHMGHWLTPCLGLFSHLSALIQSFYILISGSSAIPRLFGSQCLPRLAYGTLAHFLLGLFSHPLALQESVSATVGLWDTGSLPVWALFSHLSLQLPLGSSAIPRLFRSQCLPQLAYGTLAHSLLGLFTHPQPISISTTSFFSSGGIVFFAWLEC